MKKLSTLVLAVLLALSLVACNDSGNLPNSSTTPLPPLSTATSPPTTKPPLLQGDVGSTQTEDDEQTFGRTPAVSSSPLVEDENPTYSEDIESISVDITATNVYVLNIDTNSVLYQKNSDEYIAPASTAKILTALTVLEYCSLDDTFTVGSEINLIAADSSKAWLANGDKLTVRQLLVALLLPSGNDAAYTLAVNAGKIIDGKNNLGMQQAIEVFVDAMNQKAKEVGAVSSNFENPDGYDADGQYTTAYDLAQIAKACLSYDALLEIMSSYKISDTWANGREVTYRSTNELIDPNSQYYYSNVIGLKTGSTGDAGACLVSAAIINGQTYICVVMGSSAGIRFSDSLTVFNAIDGTIDLFQENNAAPSIAPSGLRRR